MKTVAYLRISTGSQDLANQKLAVLDYKLDGQEEEIRMLLEKEVSKASIAKIVGVSSTNLRHFIRTRKLDPKASEIQVRGRRS